MVGFLVAMVELGLLLKNLSKSAAFYTTSNLYLYVTLFRMHERDTTTEKKRY